MCVAGYSDGPFISRLASSKLASMSLNLFFTNCRSMVRAIICIPPDSQAAVMKFVAHLSLRNPLPV